MQDINMSQMTAQEVIESVEVATSIDALRKLAKDMKISFSGNTGLETLREKILTALKAFTESNPETQEEFDEPDLSADEDFDLAEIQITRAPPKKPEMNLLKLNPEDIEDLGLRRQAIRAQALRLVRVRVQNLDPADSVLDAALITLQNKYTGKVSKLVPFGEGSENGYHMPYMMYEHLKQWKFPLRKEQKGGRFGVKTYKTVMVNKFSVELLEPLTVEELRQLANHQRAAHTIDSNA